MCTKDLKATSYTGVYVCSVSYKIVQATNALCLLAAYRNSPNKYWLAYTMHVHTWSLIKIECVPTSKNSVKQVLKIQLSIQHSVKHLSKSSGMLLPSSSVMLLLNFQYTYFIFLIRSNRPSSMSSNLHFFVHHKYQKRGAFLTHALPKNKHQFQILKCHCALGE